MATKDWGHYPFSIKKTTYRELLRLKRKYKCKSWNQLFQLLILKELDKDSHKDKDLAQNVIDSLLGRYDGEFKLS